MPIVEHVSHRFWEKNAVRRLQEAISGGVYFDHFYAEVDLKPLRDYPQFKELMKPKE